MKHGISRPVLLPMLSATPLPHTEKGLLTAEMLLRFRAAIKEKMDELYEEARMAQEGMQTHSEGYGEDADSAVANEKDKNVALFVKTTPAFPFLQTAMERIENDLKGPEKRKPGLVPFGMCAEEKCREWIPQERLEALPHAATCTGCAGKQETFRESHRN